MFCTFHDFSVCGFFELVDRFSTFAELISQISNFFLQVLVLSLDGFKAVEGFFVSVLSLEQFGGHGSGFFLSGFKFNLKFFLFLLMFSDDFVKVSLFLVKSSGGSDRRRQTRY